VPGDLDYQPCFTPQPTTWDQRWQQLRNFTRAWHGIPLDPVGATSDLPAREEARLGIRFPPAFREWIDFAGELADHNAFSTVLRDGYEVSRLQDHRAVSLILQCEGDVYWAVKEEDWGEDDPPVEFYHLDYERDDGEHFAAGGTHSPHITSFVLLHMACFLHGKGGGFGVEIDPSAEFLAQMCESFDAAAKFGDLLIFERPNIFAMIEPAGKYGSDTPRLTVEVFRPIPMSEVPACVRARATNGGSFHGMFAPRRR
jgi:hypothetical protein